MSITLFKTVNFGSVNAGLETVGYTLLNTDESIKQARTTTGVYEVGTNTGVYGCDITFDDNWSGTILWDTGEATPNYASEGYNYEDYETITRVRSVETDLDGTPVYYLKNIVPMLARAIKDLGTMERDDVCGTGDGSNKVFRTSYYPLKINSLTVYEDGSEVTVDSVDWTYGVFTLNSSPALSSSITANYIYYRYPDGLLQDYIADAVIRLELKYYQGYVVYRDNNDDAYLTSTPSQTTQMLFVLQATIDYINSGLANDNLVVSREWRDEDVSESYTKSALLAKTYLENLIKERDKILSTLQTTSSSYGERLETQFNTDEAKYRYLDTIAVGSIVG